jgi:hypothetical protein
MTTFEKSMIALNLGGLLLTAIGAGVAAKSVIITREQAETTSGTYWGGNNAFRDALLSQSRAAKNGLLCVVFGSLLQAVSIVGPLFQ